MQNYFCIIFDGSFKFLQEVIPLLKENMASDCSCELLNRIRHYVGELVLSREKEHVRVKPVYLSDEIYNSGCDSCSLTGQLYLSKNCPCE